MGLSDPRSDSIEIIALQPVKKLIGINPMRLSSRWEESLDIIALKSVKKHQGLTQWDLVALGLTLLILFLFIQ